MSFFFFYALIIGCSFLPCIGYMVGSKIVIHCIWNYIISSVMQAFWLVLTYDLLEDRRIDDLIIKSFFPYILTLYYIKQIDSKLPCHISDTLGWASCATFLFLPHFDVIFDLLLNRRTATWNLFVKHKENFLQTFITRKSVKKNPFSVTKIH